MSKKWKIFWVAALAFTIFFQACGLESVQTFIFDADAEKKLGREFDSLVIVDGYGNDWLLEKGNNMTPEQEELYAYYRARANEVLKQLSDSDWKSLLPSGSLCGPYPSKTKCTEENFFEFKIIKSDIINAFALPGGYIYFYTAILDYFQSESELVTVLAHEVAHVVQHHTRDRLVKAIGGQLLIDLFLGDNIIGSLASLGYAAQLMQNSQENEHESDEIAFIYTHRMGISSQGLGDFFGRGLNFDDDDDEGKCISEKSFLDDVLQVFSTHPPSCDRVTRNKVQRGLAGQTPKSHPLDKNKLNGKTYKELVNAAKPF
ncbi:MAG: M48 family metallopeptidase [Fibromonadales bacterium]|nr:M48 family metallopeptidase [Fibromonadales bacterium]